MNICFLSEEELKEEQQLKKHSEDELNALKEKLNIKFNAILKHYYIAPNYQDKILVELINVAIETLHKHGNKQF